jgi:hypothetical protein
MRIHIGLAIVGIATLAASPVGAWDEAPTHHHRHHAHPVPRTAPPRSAEHPVQAAESEPFGSLFKPYARTGEGDEDGLSRNSDDCMKGCIGGDSR